MTGTHAAWLQQQIHDLQARHLWRTPADRAGLLNFCSNDYLNLSTHPALAAAAADASRALGTGAGASRLVSGDHPWHRTLEDRLVDWLGLPDVLLFNNGFAANSGLIPALTTADDVVFSDALNHASIIDGVRLSPATRVVFPHQDLATLEAQLHAHRATCPGRMWVLTESIFSMDGDLTDLPALADLCERHDAALIVDEAHALGVMGQGGRGAVALAGLQQRVFAVVGTCGKAMGSYGAFVAGHAPLRAWLWNRSRPFVYSTALPPATCAATLAALDLLEQGEAQDRLRQIRMAMTHALSKAGLWSGPVPEGAVFPVVIGDADRTMRVSAALAERGFFVQGIRQPTVPAGTSRLRLTVNAGITEVQVNAMVDALVHALQQTGVDATKVVQTG